MILIGIDPGKDTGLAIWDASFRRCFIDVKTCGIVEAMARIREMDLRSIGAVFMEDARLRKYLPQEKSNSEYRGKLMGAGSIKRDSAIWEEFCKYYNIPLVKLKPAQGMTKWTQDYFEKVTGWKGRTSHHCRDAALLVFGKTSQSIKNIIVK